MRGKKWNRQENDGSLMRPSKPRPCAWSPRADSRSPKPRVSWASRLGLEAQRISHWKKQLQQQSTPERAFPGQGHEHDAELARLRRENAALRNAALRNAALRNAALRMERDILKKRH
jgi:hypothetical protein